MLQSVSQIAFVPTAQAGMIVPSESVTANTFADALLGNFNLETAVQAGQEYLENETIMSAEFTQYLEVAMREIVFSGSEGEEDANAVLGRLLELVKELINNTEDSGYRSALAYIAEMLMKAPNMERDSSISFLSASVKSGYSVEHDFRSAMHDKVSIASLNSEFGEYEEQAVKITADAVNTIPEDGMEAAIHHKSDYSVELSIKEPKEAWTEHEIVGFMPDESLLQKPVKTAKTNEKSETLVLNQAVQDLIKNEHAVNAAPVFSEPVSVAKISEIMEKSPKAEVYYENSQIYGHETIEKNRKVSDVNITQEPMQPNLRSIRNEAANVQSVTDEIAGHVLKTSEFAEQTVQSAQTANSNETVQTEQPNPINAQFAGIMQAAKTIGEDQVYIDTKQAVRTSELKQTELVRLSARTEDVEAKARMVLKRLTEAVTEGIALSKADSIDFSGIFKFSKLSGVPIYEKLSGTDVSAEYNPADGVIRGFGLGLAKVQKPGDLQEVLSNLRGKEFDEPPIVNPVLRELSLGKVISLDQADSRVSVARQISDQITARLAKAPNNSFEFEMTLNPEELGKIIVKLVSDSSGMSLSIKAERPETAAILHNRAENMTTALMADGIKLENYIIETEPRHDLYYGQDGKESGNRDRQDDGQPAEERDGGETEDELNFSEFLRMAI
ncbi:MAG: flagellar hook-length control protein FliK [Eubacterium sp.]|jgi:hypothetical protein|nr:flagellar hook-length control protein FliK [Eubacterium sp.]